MMGPGRMCAALVILVAVGCTGGCSVVRMAAMEGIGRSEIPVPAGGARLSSHTQGMAAYPFVEVRIRCPMPAAETLAWYRDRLVAEGWELKVENEGWTRTYGTINGHSWYFASRKRWKWGNEWLLKERLELILEAGERDAVVEVKIVGDYVWDWPGKVVIAGLNAAMMPVVYAAEEFAQVTHTGFAGFVIVLAPFYVPAYAMLLIL